MTVPHPRDGHATRPAAHGAPPACGSKRGIEVAGKPKATRAIDGRTIAEACPKGRHRLRRDVLPGMLAYLLMLGGRYQRTADAIRSDRRSRDVPGAAEHLRHLDWSARLCEELANRLAETFASSEWYAAVDVVRAALASDADGSSPDPSSIDKFLSE